MRPWLSRSLIAIPLTLVVVGLSVPALSGDGTRTAPVLAPAPAGTGTSWVAPAIPSVRSQGSTSTPLPGQPGAGPSTSPAPADPAVTSQLVTGTGIPVSTLVVNTPGRPRAASCQPWWPRHRISGGQHLRWPYLGAGTDRNRGLRPGAATAAPDGSTGWLEAGAVRSARTPWAVAVSLSSRSLTVYRSGQALGTWPVGVGAVGTPTPVDRTFISGDIAPVGIDSGLAPVIRPLGLHTSIPAVADEFPGGVIAIHGWRSENTDAAIFGRAISHGCIRVPASGLAVIGQIPTGSPVVVEG